MQRHAGDCVSENSTEIVVPGSVVRRFKIGIKLGYIPSDPFRKWFSACNHCAIRARRVSYSAYIYIYINNRVSCTLSANNLIETRYSNYHPTRGENIF